jgi:hypothetical protein
MAATNSEFQAMYSVRTQPFRPSVENMRPGPYGEVQGVYHYMILTHREYKTINMKNSQMYWDIVRNHVPVWVKKSTCVGVTKPVYSDHTQFPDVTHNNPRNTTDYFEVKPHMMERRQKAQGGQKPEEERSYRSQQFEYVPSDAAGDDSDAAEPDQDPSRGRFYLLPDEAEN